ALGKEEVVEVGGFDVGDPPLVPIDPHFALEPGQVQGALAGRGRAAQVPVAAADDGRRADDQEGQEHQQDNHQRAPPPARPEGEPRTPAHRDRVPPTGWLSGRARWLTRYWLWLVPGPISAPRGAFLPAAAPWAARSSSTN